ncbi:MAG: hypothetical protein IJP02_05085 [Oscillospiraceae bacterium]|nr:hypothetical protein [Oscillospiraceae bacterium]
MRKHNRLFDLAIEDMPTADAAVPEEVIPADTPSADSPSADGPLPYHRRYYLRYRDAERCAPMDLSGTRAFLQGCGFDGGELSQARGNKALSEALGGLQTSAGNQMHCSYCGCEVSGVEFYRLPDGRLRCTTCSNSLVSTKAEMEAICQRVIANMDSFFGADLRVPVSIECMESRRLKRRLGIPLGTADAQSLLILGVAINKKKKYSIILENGAPRISLIATFAHELTHIWQYTNWDNKKGFPSCPKNKRLLIYEGMAKWAEIQYLYLVGETAAARREELRTLNRTDEYGLGFRLYEDRYPLSREAMFCQSTPFTPDRFPFSD